LDIGDHFRLSLVLPFVLHDGESSNVGNLKRVQAEGLTASEIAELTTKENLE